MEPIAIFPGRLQPPHNDHLALIERALTLVRGPLVLALLVGGGRASDTFGHEAAEHHEPARNPFTFLQRAAMIDAALPPHARSRVRVVPLPRPECAWDVCVSAFPGPRLWVVPDAGDPFDDAKAAWLTAHAEAVARPRITPTTDGRLVRALVARGDPELRRHVPEPVADLIEAWQQKQRLDAAWRTSWAHEPE